MADYVHGHKIIYQVFYTDIYCTLGCALLY